MAIRLKKICVIGAGSYGTAIAQCFSERVEEVILISDVEEISNNINSNRAHSMLAGIVLSKNLSCYTNIKATNDSDIIFVAVPSGVVQAVGEDIKEHAMSQPIVLCSKGFDLSKNRLLGDMMTEILPSNEILALSGPSFANEIADGLYAGVNIASDNFKLAVQVADQLTTPVFQVKAINDMKGLQIAGAMKNILAVGCGILSGLNAGKSAIAKLIVIGIEEMRKLAEAMGGKESTFFELCGIGDIVLTCTSEKSRNVKFGEYIANGGKIKEWNGLLAEGAIAAKAIPDLFNRYSIQSNVFYEIYKIICEIENIHLHEACNRLLSIQD